ncbi:MAG: serine/threonine protein kinase, partial [Phototrophicales bacterium]
MATTPDLSGRILGQYQIIERIGEGGMAAVYRARQINLDREVALKTLPDKLAQNPQYEERFEREAKAVASLQHPHIVPIFDSRTDHGISYITMRLLTGGSLGDRMANREKQGADLPSLSEIAQLLKQVGSALDYAHGRGVIHRDIKPSNIMFDDQGNPFIVDFGIAKVL